MIDRTCFSSEQTKFLENMEKNELIVHDFVLEEKEKLLKACSDIAILTEMTKRNALSASDIAVFFEKNYDISLSPRTLYPILYRLERKGYIRLLPNRRKRSYVLTEYGRKAMEDFQLRLDETQSFIVFLLHK